MFKKIENGLLNIFDTILPGKRMKIDIKSKTIALKYFFRILKKYDPETCFIGTSDIRNLRKMLLRRYHRNKIIRYLLKLISYVYATPYENHIIDSKYDFYKHARMYEDFHK